MKTIAQIEKEITSLKNEIITDFSQVSSEKLKQKRRNKLIYGKIDDLRFLVNYLKTEPREAFVIKERDRLAGIKEKMAAGYKEWRDRLYHLPDRQKKMANYIKDIGAELWGRQLNALNYLINEAEAY